MAATQCGCVIAQIVGVTSDWNNRAGARFGSIGVSSGECWINPV